MVSGWTAERKARQAALIRTWRPWEQSTGPRTAQGKAQAASNGRESHGLTPEILAQRSKMRDLMRAVGELLREQREVQSELKQELRGSFYGDAPHE